MAFVVQYGQEQINHTNMSYVQKEIHNTKELAKQEGYFSAELVSGLKKKIAAQLGVEEESIIITATGAADRKERGEIMTYSITIPFRNYVGAGSFWGIAPEDNVVMKTYNYETTSEWIGR